MRRMKAQEKKRRRKGKRSRGKKRNGKGNSRLIYRGIMECVWG